MRALAIAVVALALLPATAAAKTGIMLQSTPEGYMAGEPWDAQFQYVLRDELIDPPAGSHPSVVITSETSGRSLTFEGRRMHNGMWQARVIFPKAGRWSYKVRGFGRAAMHQFWDPVTILPKARPSEPATVPQPVKAGVGGDGGSFPYGWVGTGAAALLIAGVAVLRLRKSS
jgi:hypothetical protein